ncbi:MAG: hypothetical protein H6Q30_1136 [Bacteroidetes bacterium]|nr:hypothetical protein [Bacteroidota bacterium]
MKLRLGILIAGFILLGGLCQTGCKDEETLLPGESPSTVIFPERNVSFGVHVQTLFNQTCALASCHDDGSHAGGLALTSYYNTVFAVPGVVISKDPANSILVMKIEGRGPAGDRMPPFTNPLNQNQINGIRTWIAEGALNN